MPKVNIDILHLFSVEIDPGKRKFIARAHTPPGKKPSFHIFSDVRIFSDGNGFCDTCQRVHEAPNDVDILFVGPSCKKLSKEFLGRDAYKKCYISGDGCSGYTYVHGCRGGVEATSPAVMFFENVLGVAESSYDKETKEKTTPLVEAMLCHNCCIAWIFV